jgi:hypothetical protein
MMQKVVCDGCGTGESLSTPEKIRTIRPVKLHIVSDSRTSMANNDGKHEADLCDDCQFKLLIKYFKVKDEDTLEIPDFLESSLRA